MKRLLLTLLGLALASVSWASSGPYDYPFADPYVATVISTPSEFEAPLPEKVRMKMLALTVFENRNIPDVFWYQNKLRYSLAYQKKKAPLIFVIAGTGASFYSSNMQLFQKAFFEAGFHVISLSSPTHPNFIVTASTSSVPGHIVEDSRDLYRVMELAWQQVKDRIEVSEFYLTGYSLGAAQAAFVSKLDEDKGSFNFKKVLMINPPLSLYTSVNRLDKMLVENIPGGLDHFDAFWDNLMRKFAEFYELMGYVDFSDDYLYEIYKKRKPKDEANLAALIGLSFRLSSSNMVFTSDVMSNAGLIVPKNRVLSTYESLTDYVKVAARTSFLDYFNELFIPYFEVLDPGMTQEAMIESLSLASIEPYLKKAGKIGLVTNEDDLILGSEEVDYFRQVFGSRARIYPIGGHCGNMAYKDNIEYMLDFFKNEGGVQ